MAITNYTQYSHWLPNWAFKLMAHFYIDYKYPRHIYIETTTRCNLMCTHCPRPKIEEDMHYDVFYKIILESSQWGARSFSLHGFGEPTMDKDLTLKMRAIKYLNKKNNIILTTNGVKLIPEAYDLADKIIITYKAPYNLEKYERWKHKIMLRIFDDKQPPGSWMCEHKQYHNFGGNIKSDIIASPRYPCYHLWLSPMIAWNGDMLLCCNDPNHQVVIGNVERNSIAEVWQRELPYFREQHKKENYQFICKDCNVWSNYRSIM